MEQKRTEPAEPRLGTSLDDLHMRVSFAYRLMRNCTNATARGLGLGPGQPRVLSYIAAHGGSTQREIATFFYIDPSAVSRMLDSLERGGFIACVPGRDRRSKIADLTERGRAAIAAWDRECAEVERVMVTGFSDAERDTLFGLLERVEENLRSELAARGRSASLPGEEYRRPEGEEGRRA